MNWFKSAVRRMSIEDALGVLGISGTPSSRSEVQNKYRQMAMKYHPDRPGGDSVRMVEISEAWDIVKDVDWSTYQPGSGQDEWVPHDFGYQSRQTSDLPEWQTDERSTYNGVGSDFRNLNFCLKSIYDEAVKHGEVRKISFDAFDGSFFRSSFTAYANEATLGYAGRVMAIWNSAGGNPYGSEAVTANMPGNKVQVVWLKGQDVSNQAIFFEHDSFNANPSNDRSFVEEFKRYVSGAGLDVSA